ncbi:dephospho-CoA kinase [Microbacterium sp. SLBN-146]|uniref:dephospho-CoA kinase n=1 Tax=Microbacterium sp. SLBN-146 TaxID=2768457 RepID=UPI00114E3034|nr:dephospho-CoA kinase [Microbacterium sp. SLBN-146]TQJ32325.1 dephospho-CoA kinase [Microbacterium sp. SLBN-146]
MPLIALTGGIASGKSTIASRLAERGAVIVDADRIVRDVQAPGSPLLGAMVDAFGPDILTDEGALDRAGLGRRVFNDEAALARLNALVHPAVRAESARRFAEAFDADPDAVVVYDVPLLAETRAADPWDLVVVAHAPAGVRQGRLVELRGMSEDDAAARIAAQVADDDRLRIADVVIDTTGTLEDTLARTDELWNDLPRRVAEVRQTGSSDLSVD